MDHSDCIITPEVIAAILPSLQGISGRIDRLFQNESAAAGSHDVECNAIINTIYEKIKSYLQTMLPAEGDGFHGKVLQALQYIVQLYQHDIHESSAVKRLEELLELLRRAESQDLDVLFAVYAFCGSYDERVFECLLYAYDRLENYNAILTNAGAIHITDASSCQQIIVNLHDYVNDDDAITRIKNISDNLKKMVCFFTNERPSYESLQLLVIFLQNYLESYIANEDIDFLYSEQFARYIALLHEHIMFVNDMDLKNIINQLIAFADGCPEDEHEVAADAFVGSEAVFDDGAAAAGGGDEISVLSESFDFYIALLSRRRAAEAAEAAEAETETVERDGSQLFRPALFGRSGPAALPRRRDDDDDDDEHHAAKRPHKVGAG